MTSGGRKRCSTWICWRSAACCCASHTRASCREAAGASVLLRRRAHPDQLLDRVRTADHRIDRVRQDQDARDRRDRPGRRGDGPLPAGGPHRRGGGMTMSQDAPRRTRLADARHARMDRPEVAAAYEQTRLRYELGEAVRLRREVLGWSQRQLAERAGMSQPGVARFEARRQRRLIGQQPKESTGSAQSLCTWSVPTGARRRRRSETRHQGRSHCGHADCTGRCRMRNAFRQHISWHRAKLRCVRGPCHRASHQGDLEACAVPGPEQGSGQPGRCHGCGSGHSRRAEGYPEETGSRGCPIPGLSG